MFGSAARGAVGSSALPGGRALQIFEGQPIGKGRRVALAVSRFNPEVTEKLLEGALAELRRSGVAEDDLTVMRVPGSFELPLAAQRLARTRRFDAIVALGAVIRGQTDHYEHVCRAAQEGLMRIGLEEDLPVLFGVLTCDTDDQAMARAGGEHGNKGADVALDALHLIDLYKRFSARAHGRRRRP